MRVTKTHGSITHGEIFQQPELWPTTLERVRQHAHAIQTARSARTAILTGAGSSAHAATAIAAAWPDGHAIPTTDLLLDPRSAVPSGFAEHGVLVSLARSGDSPETAGVVEIMQRLHPSVRHLAITCNEKGRLAATPGVDAVLLDPRTNDRSLAVTSSFTNVVLAGLCLRHFDAVAGVLPAICARRSR
jgi:tagatose-6-phosphate ketose/aldose isomerase